ncbi:MAG: hypothetical protein V1899_06700 [Planctomycetota bacterium]
MNKNRKQLFTDLTDHDCTCRVCGVAYIGHGALCEKHQAPPILVCGQVNAIIEAREAADRAARKARGRTEWHEFDKVNATQAKPKIRRDALPMGVDFDWSDIEAADAKG